MRLSVGALLAIGCWISCPIEAQKLLWGHLIGRARARARAHAGAASLLFALLVIQVMLTRFFFFFFLFWLAFVISFDGSYMHASNRLELLQL